MLSLIKENIESKRNSQKPLWLLIISIKDYLYNLLYIYIPKIWNYLSFGIMYLTKISKLKKYKTRNDLLNTLPKNAVFGELGVFIGEFSDKIIEICKPKELHLIDIWQGGTWSGDKDGRNIKKVEDMEIVYENLTKKYADNSVITLHREDTVSSLKKFQDDYFDIVYIDSSHTYKHTKKELELAKTKVKKGGYILGHDYCPQFYGVVRAVNEFCAVNNYKIDSLTDDICSSFCVINKK